MQKNGKVPLGVLFFWKVFPNARCGKREKWYKAQVLILTFFAYTCYHMAKRPISVVKGTLNPNCTIEKYNNTCNAWKPFKDPDISADLFGALDSAFLFSYAIAMFFSGYIAEHTSVRLYLGSGMFITGIFTSLFGLAYYLKIHSVAYFVGVQILSGVFQATGWPCVVATMGNWFEKGRLGLIMGIWNSHTSVGNILGGVVAGIWSDDQWGLSFIVPGAIIAGFGIIIVLFLVSNPAYVGLMKDIERAPGSIYVEANENNLDDDIGRYDAISDSTGSSRINTIKEGKAIGFIGALCIPGVIEYSVCLFFAKLVSYTFLFWLPFYIQNTKIGGKYSTSEHAADLATFFDVGGLLGGILAGYISDVTKCRGITNFTMLILSAPALILYRFYGNSSIELNVGYMVISGVFVNGPYALITTAVSASLGTHDSLRGNTKAMSTVSAIIDGTGSLGAATGPLLASLISRHSWSDVFYLLIAADVIAALLLTRQVIFETKTIDCSFRNRRDNNTGSNSSHGSINEVEREHLLSTDSELPPPDTNT